MFSETCLKTVFVWFCKALTTLDQFDVLTTVQKGYFVVLPKTTLAKISAPRTANTDILSVYRGFKRMLSFIREGRTRSFLSAASRETDERTVKENWKRRGKVFRLTEIMLKRNPHGGQVVMKRKAMDAGLKLKKKVRTTATQWRWGILWRKTMKRASLVTLRQLARYRYGFRRCCYLTMHALAITSSIHKISCIFTCPGEGVGNTKRKEGSQRKREKVKKSLINIRPGRRSFCSSCSFFLSSPPPSQNKYSFRTIPRPPPMHTHWKRFE